ncbi:MAG: hypothetical protein P9M11_09605 [Candidatus Tenebribacter burtonii]|nr:hypothetical protein [Candidatus Tenebribacter burtonii]
MEYERCPICGSPSLINEYSHDIISIYKVNCLRCGKYEINEEVIEFEIDNDKLSPEQIANVSGWIRENQDIIIDNEKLKSKMILKTLSVAEKADKILKYLAKQFPVAGTNIDYDFNKVKDVLSIIQNQSFPESQNDPFMIMFNKNAPNLLPLISVGRIIDAREFNFIREDYLINEKKYISKEQKITPAGWAYLESLRQANPESKNAFVAMWFTPMMEKIYDNFIKKAIIKAGYKPIQIGRKQHNNDINDEIIGEIRSSKFIVADFTGNRGGVYYEAGFAYGLKIEVIYTCKKDWWDKVIKKRVKAELKNKTIEFVKIKEERKVHFDLNHKSFILWKNGDELYKQLLDKINSTIT